MANPYFRFKQFTVYHDRCAMKVTTDACLFGAYVAEKLNAIPQIEKQDAIHFLDIGTGTGLLSLMVAQKTSAIIEAVEIDRDAAAQAAANVSDSPFSDRIYIVHDDILKFDTGKKFNAIFSNPPFYEADLRSPLAGRNRAHHSDDLKFTDLLLRIKALLSPGGACFLLLPFKRMKEMENFFAEHALFIKEKLILKPAVHLPPFRFIVEMVQEPTEMLLGEMSIRGVDNEYTPEFVALLKEYYLYLEG
jgi:tRNA1Val (adenine37-N6)-methyltransferase